MMTVTTTGMQKSTEIEPLEVFTQLDDRARAQSYILQPLSHMGVILLLHNTGTQHATQRGTSVTLLRIGVSYPSEKPLSRSTCAAAVYPSASHHQPRRIRRRTGHHHYSSLRRSHRRATRGQTDGNVFFCQFILSTPVFHSLAVHGSTGPRPSRALWFS